MIKYLFVFLLLSTTVSAQKLSKIELLSAIATDICKDIADNKVEVKSEQILGLYMIKNVNKHKEEVEHHFGKDFLIKEDAFESVGEELGMYMGMTCPEVFEHFWMEEATENVEIKTIEGSLTNIRKEQFLSFTVQENSGKKHDFILLYDFETAYLLTDSLLKIKDKVEISYYASEIYDAKIGKFINYNIVSYIEAK